MSNERDTKREIRRIVRMLETTSKHLDRASVLDNFSDGEARCIRQFNNALARLNDLEALPEGLFDPLEDNASLGDIGFAYNQVSTYLKEGFGFDIDYEFKQEKETIGNILKDIGLKVGFQSTSEDSDDPDSDGSATVEVVEIEDDDTPDPVEPRLEKLEEQMETVVQILQEMRPKKNKKDKKDDKE